MKKYFGLIVIAFFVLAIIVSINPSVKTFRDASASPSPCINEKEENPGQKTIVLDAGHGGFDPGKIGVNGALEKDVNLSIALKLEKCLTEAGYKVVMTRTEDKGLYNEGDSNKKRTDMRKRVEIVNGNNADIAVSIHQNSFTQESSKGAQVFYHNTSDDGKILAEVLQNKIKESMQDGNKRMAKSNDTYYMLKKTQCPLVIIECGFLSNNEEAKLLIDDAYQEKIVSAIKDGIIAYFEQNT